jgi:hypothetical protein
MYNPQASFRNILNPVKSEDFFASDYGRKARYIPGPDDKFSGLFDWGDLNRFLSFEKTWDSHSLKMVLDGEPIPPVQYCPQGTIDRAAVGRFLDQGATLALIGFETLSDGACALFKSIQAATGAVCGGNLYFSRNQHAGFLPHFDLMDVFVLHIAGEKTWNVYETQFEQPMYKPGFHHMSFSRDYHAQNKGAIEAKVVMTPGDVLYLPRGKYHAALATSDASLHITFGIEPARGFDYLQALIETMPSDPLFREEIPHFDNVEAHEAYLGKLADRMRDKMADPEVMAQMRSEQRQRACNNLPVFTLPNGNRQPGFHVKVTGSKLVRRGKSWQLTTPSGQGEIDAALAPLVEWMLLSDLFAFDDLAAAFPDKPEEQLGSAIADLTDAGLITGF